MDTSAFVANNAGLVSGHVAVVSVLASLYGAVTVLLSWIFLRERMDRTQWFGIVLIFVGIVLVSLDWLVVAAAFSAASVGIVLRHLVQAQGCPSRGLETQSLYRALFFSGIRACPRLVAITKADRLETHRPSRMQPVLG